MQDSNGTTATTSVPRRPTVALVGNPNTGKTTLFNALAGMRQHVGNYPGVTVETKKGHLTFRAQTFDLIDLPGTYSLAPRSPDEMVAVDLILGQQAGEPRPDVVVSIVDASNLERNLYLTTQVLELGVPVVLALNMIDVAKAQGLTIDAAKLRKQLGVRVVEIQANKGRGLEDLKEMIAEAIHAGGASSGPAFPEAFEREVQVLADVLGSDVSPFLVRRMLLDVGGYTEQRLAHHALRGNGDGARHPTLADLLRSARQRLSDAGCGVPGVEARTRYAWIRGAMTGCVDRPAQRPITVTDRLDRILTHRIWGTLVFLALMFLVFEAIFEGARPLMKAISAGKDWLADLANQLPPGPFTSLLADGVIEGVGAVVVFLPQIMILFGFIAILEDCGYMARAAFLMDRLMARCGLSGKSFIPMLSSVACAVPGIMATRVIENRRDRLTTILVAPLMSCSARLPVYMLLIGAFLGGHAWWIRGLVMFAMYALGIVVAPLVAFVLKRTLLRGETPVFVMEMPMYKMPSPILILRRMYESGWAFLRRAGTLIFASMVLVWVLLFFPHTDADGVSYFTRIGELRNSLKEDEVYQEAKERVEKLEDENPDDPELDSLKAVVEAREKPLNDLESQWKRNSYLGRMGRAIEPVVRPLGWDWKIGTAALASFPAREVVVGTLGILYSEGKVDSEEIRKAKDVRKTGLGGSLISATWDQEPERKVFTIPVALSLMVFFALCCQCASTLAVIRRETRSWGWPAFTFAYMTILAYIGAFITYQVGTWIQSL